MKETISMWRHTRMVILTALAAAIYAAVLIPFKAGIPIFPGVTEVRPANALPPVFGLMFGPAGAWGAAIGNTIGDIFGGGLGLGTFFGFIGNFYLGFVVYKLWGAIGLVARDDATPNVNSWRKLVAYAVVAITASVACAVIIAWGLDLVGLVPFAFLAVVISLNNTVTSLLLGPPLLLVLYPRVKKMGLLWTELMSPAEVGSGFARHFGAAVMLAGTWGGLLAGLGVATGVHGQQILKLTAGNLQKAGTCLSVLPFLVAMVVAGFMLSGREQFTEE
ncbi:MAG: QueT transporter family protein [Verrucomicrobiae bacterium]|nr:QueT transporter family protein [Verrucomicrobiae bacterium]